MPKQIYIWPGNFGIHLRNAIVSFQEKIATLFELLVDGSITSHTHLKWSTSPTPSWRWGIMRQIIATNCSNNRRAGHPRYIASRNARLQEVLETNAKWAMTVNRFLWSLHHIASMMANRHKWALPTSFQPWRTGTDDPLRHKSFRWWSTGTCGPWGPHHFGVGA